MQENKAVVRLDAIRSNAEILRKHCGAKKLCAVVKADAYGHGAAEVAGALSGEADMFAVALVSEGEALRLSCAKDILVLVPPLTESEALRGMNSDLIFSVGDAEDYALLRRTAEKYGTVARCHLKVNTGMNRFGFDGDAFRSFLRGGLSDRVCVEGIYSHFYLPNDVTVVGEQFGLFSDFAEEAERVFGDLIKHVSATGGILYGKEYALDMVRPGIGLYGYLPAGFEGALSLRKAMRVYASVVSSREYAFGGAGYGKLSNADAKNGLSAVRCGYADGFFRGGGIGNVNSLCMDAFIYSQKLEKYEELCILSDADEYARKNGTISYEVLVNAGRRAEKIYVGG